MRRNIALLTDSYKLTHHQQYPEGTEYVYSYFEARDGSEYPYTVFFGLQYFLEQLKGSVITPEEVDAARDFCDAHMGPGIFNYDMWMKIATIHNGRLPIRIKAVPEGSVVPNSNVLMTIENTDPECAALTNHLETWLCHLWHSCNVATLSRRTKEMMKRFLKQTSDNPDAIQFMLHDFGMRGVSSMESAAIGGAAHLVNFSGTDTVIALTFLREYYEADMAGFSVPATEHSVMTALGREGEFEQVDRLLDLYPSGILSVVSDSYDIYAACRMYGTRFKDRILAREGRFVVRPDSGNPIEVVIKCFNILEEFFGSTKNSKGYKVLPPQIGMIWGDGVDYDGIQEILYAMERTGWAADNIVFGMGGGLLQKHNRDTQRFAFKASAICINGEWRDVFKDPKEGKKRSKKGRLALAKMGELYYTVGENDVLDMNTSNELVEVFLNGEILEYYTLDEIRENAKL